MTNLEKIKAILISRIENMTCIDAPKMIYYCIECPLHDKCDEDMDYTIKSCRDIWRKYGEDECEDDEH